ncbi:MAG: hypothetical protein NPIRA06_31330 [Nitrospirales bacterium]|nr:MAG: hypothetical protein NPIRA06_31330 [Nitrospirales bacterium]
MENRVTPLIEEIKIQVKGLESHLANLSKVIEESEIDQAHESLDHLKICAHSLESAFENEALRTVPILDLTELKKLILNVANTLPPMTQDIASSHANFTNHVDALHRKLWTMRLIDPRATEAVLMNSAGKLDSALETSKKHIKELEKGLEIREQVGIAAEEVSSLKAKTAEESEKISKILAAVEAHEKTVLAQEAKATEHASQAGQILAIMQNLETTTRTIEAELTNWHNEIGAKRKEIDALRDSTTTRLTTYDDDIHARQENLDDVKKRIEEQFQLVSSGALAKAFGDRGTQLLWGMYGWGALAVLSYVFAIGFALWLAGSTIPDPTTNETVNPLNWNYFLVRLAVGIPIAFFVWFATVQFSKAKRLQESYAFKGTVAASFDAYRKLVEAISKDPELKENPEFAKFITSIIGDLYKPPQHNNEDEDNPPHTQALKETGALLKQLESLISKLK